MKITQKDLAPLPSTSRFLPILCTQGCPAIILLSGPLGHYYIASLTQPGMTSCILKDTRTVHNLLSWPISYSTCVSTLLSASNRWKNTVSLLRYPFFLTSFLSPAAVFQKPFLCSAFHSCPLLFQMPSSQLQIPSTQPCQPLYIWKKFWEMCFSGNMTQPAQPSQNSASAKQPCALVVWKNSTLLSTDVSAAPELHLISFHVITVLRTILLLVLLMGVGGN